MTDINITQTPTKSNPNYRWVASRPSNESDLTALLNRFEENGWTITTILTDNYGICVVAKIEYNRYLELLNQNQARASTACSR